MYESHPFRPPRGGVYGAILSAGLLYVTNFADTLEVAECVFCTALPEGHDMIALRPTRRLAAYLAAVVIAARKTMRLMRSQRWPDSLTCRLLIVLWQTDSDVAALGG